MININTWFYCINPYVAEALRQEKLSFNNINYKALAREFTDLSLFDEVNKLNDHRSLSEEAKIKMVEEMVNSLLLSLSSESGIELQKYLDEERFGILNKIFYNVQYQDSNAKPEIDYSGLTSLLSDLNKADDYFYVDTYSIFKLAQLFSSRKIYFHMLKECLPSDNKRKHLFKWWKDANEIIQSKRTKKSNMIDFEMRLFICNINRNPHY